MGYILRLTEENSYDRPKWIFDLAGLKARAGNGGWPMLYHSHSSLRSLEKVLGFEYSGFNGVRYRTGETYGLVNAYGLTMPARHLRFRSPKVCTACLKQSNYHRAVWDLLPFTACPEHGLILISTCAKCKKHITWARSKMGLCRCGADLRECPTAEADSSTLHVSEQLLKLCDLCAEGGTSEVKKGNPLFELNLGDLSCVLTILADYYLIIKDGRRVIAETDNFFCHQAYSYAFRAFVDWPENFYKYLDGSDCLSGSNIYNSIIYRQIRAQCDKKPLHFVIIAVEDYIEKITRKTATQGRTYPPAFRRFIDNEEMCRRLKVSQKRLDALIEHGKLNLTYRWGSLKALIDGERIKDMGNKWRDLLPIRSAAKLLRVETHEVEYLVRHGCLKAVDMPDANGLSEWWVDKEEVSRFINAIRSGIVSPIEQSGKGVVGTKRIITHLRRLDIEANPFTSEYKLWARALAALIENNVDIRRRRPERRRTSYNSAMLDIRDLARIGRQMFFRLDIRKG